MKRFSFSKSASDITVIFLNADEDHDEIDDDASEDSETICDDVRKNDDEIRSKKKSTEVAL